MLTPKTSDPNAVQEALANAAPEALEAHKSLLSEAFQMLEHQGINPQTVVEQVGVGTTNPNQMSHTDLISTTLALARSHPEIVEAVAKRFPQAQGLVSTVLSSANGDTEGGLLGGLLSRVLGR